MRILTLDEITLEVAMGPFGSNLKTDSFRDSGIPVLRGQNLNDFAVSHDGLAFVSEEKANSLGRAVAGPGDIVITHRGTLGQVSMIPKGAPFESYVVSQSQMRLRVDEKVAIPEYITYWLRSQQGQHAILTFAAQSGVPAIAQPTASIKSLQMPIPELAVQRAVAEVLGALDEKIAANRAVIEVIDQLLPEIIASSVTIEIPIVKSGIQLVFGEAFKGAYFEGPGEGTPLIRIRDLKSQQCAVWTSEVRPKQHMVEPGDVLVGMDAEFRANRWCGPTGLLNQRVLAVESQKYGPAVVREALRPALSRIERGKVGTTVIHLNKADLEQETVMVPLDSELDKLRALVDPQWALAISLEKEARALDRTRDELLPLLMSGKITVRDAEKRVEEVA